VTNRANLTRLIKHTGFHALARQPSIIAFLNPVGGLDFSGYIVKNYFKKS
jgi:hypothetical protein